MNNHKILCKTKWFFGNANIAGPILQSEESGLRFGTMYDGLKIIFLFSWSYTKHTWTPKEHQSNCIDNCIVTVLCLFLYKNSGVPQALTQFPPESHLGGSAGHGHLYYDPPDAEFLLGLQDPKVAMSYHS